MGFEGMMNRMVRWRGGRWSVLLALAMGLANTALGCGLDWKLPTNHFDGVDPQGHVSYWEKIGAVDCGDGLVLPLHLNFSSKRDAGAPSPYVGQGWLLPLLESKFIQEGEDRFVMLQPDGLSNLFLRRGGSEGTVLDGSAGWKGEIQGGETITAWAPCGWKLTFAHGKIASMSTDKGRKLDYIYEGGRVTELREGNVTRLKVEYDTQGKAAALALADGKRILLVQDKKPRVQSVGGQNVIAGVDGSLSEVTLADGSKRHYGFGTDEQRLPTLSVERAGEPKEMTTVVTGESDSTLRTFAWNPQSRLAVRDGAWMYNITPALRQGENVAVSRTNSQGKKEYWFYDAINGQENTLGSDGVLRTKYWFVTGVLAGSIRKIEESKDGRKQVSYQAAYDAEGRLIRVINADGKTTSYGYDENGNQFEAIMDGKILWRKKYNAKGVLREELFSSGTQIYYEYKDNGSLEKTTKQTDGSFMVQTILNGLEIQRRMPNGDVYSYEYNPSGVLLKRIDPDKSVWTFVYDESGKVIETFTNGQLLYKLFKDRTNGNIIRVKYDKSKAVEGWDWIADKTFSNPSDKMNNATWVPLT